MKPESIALCDVLLERHQRLCVIADRRFDQCLISYGELCNEARLPYLVRSVGQFLFELRSGVPRIVFLR